MKESLHRLHRPVVESLVQSLRTCFFEARPADKVLEFSFRNNKKLGSRDRKFFAETFYEVVRWRRRLAFAANVDETHPDSVWSLIGAFLLNKDLEIPEWPEFSHLHAGEVQRRYKSPPEFSITQSIPEWMDELGNRELKDRWPALAAALNVPAPVFLRTNTLKTHRRELQKQLDSEDIETSFVPELEDALELKTRKSVFAAKSFHEGLFEMQDGASQMIAPFLQATPGMRVIDACAGAGGKSLHLAAILQNKGKIIALDVHDKRLAELQFRARRAGVSIIETRHIDSTKVTKRLADSADRVLLDVPCSGMGVLRRNPDAKWKLKPEEIERLHGVQKDILESYSKMVKPGGKMVYATCSILPSENQWQVQKFLEKSAEWTLEEEIFTSPSSSRFDGFYAARLARKA